mmetsp:Transcript_13615/g.11385  ORF Transcript_13615/g.11385 Transcript_13615/m.11385 type:complete len:124 (+) Transcript_13615:426-797(+)
MDINKFGIINQDEIERWRGIDLAFKHFEVCQDFIVWVEFHVIDSFNQIAKIMFNSIIINGKCTKSDFINWFTRKITGLKHSDQTKLANSMRKIFDAFDIDGSNLIEFDEFKTGFWRVEAFFEG